MGFEAAVHLAKRAPSTLILAVRSVAKGDTAAEKIHKRCPAYRGKIEVWELDMASFKSVLAFGKKCAGLSRLDIAILNAGMTGPKYTKTSDGWEYLLQVRTVSS